MCGVFVLFELLLVVLSSFRTVQERTCLLIVRNKLDIIKIEKVE